MMKSSTTLIAVQHPIDTVKAWHVRYRAFSVCGTDCAACYCYGKMCNGCNSHQGKVFHAPEGKACPIYECSVTQKGLSSCGACDKVPCGIWRSTKDPKFSDEEFEENIKARLHALEKGV